MADTADFIQARLDGMVDLRHPLVVLSKRLPWAAIEQALAPHFAPEWVMLLQNTFESLPTLRVNF